MTSTQTLNLRQALRIHTEARVELGILTNCVEDECHDKLANVIEMFKQSSDLFDAAGKEAIEHIECLDGLIDGMDDEYAQMLKPIVTFLNELKKYARR